VTYALVYYLTLATQAASRRAVPTALYRGNSTAARETSEAVTGDKNSAQQSAMLLLLEKRQKCWTAGKSAAQLLIAKRQQY